MPGSVLFENIDRRLLIEAALDARAHAYAPYSGFKVGAAALFDSGKIYVGTNVENASYPAGICAERNAVFHGAACGERKLLALAVCGSSKELPEDYCAPCGVCRQVAREFGAPDEILLLLARSSSDYLEKTLEELLPFSFGPESL